MALVWFVIILFMVKLLVVTSFYGKQQQYKVIGNVLIGLIVNVIIWLLCEMGTQIVLTDSSIIFFHELKFIAILSIPGLLFTFAYELYYHKKILLHHQIRNIGIPIIFIILIASNFKHHLFRSSIYVEYGLVNIVHVENDFIYYLTILYTYLTLAFTIILFVKYYIEQPKIYRKQIGWILIGISFGVITNIVFQILQMVIKWQFDFTPLSFGIIVWFFYGVFFEYSNTFIKNIVQESVSEVEGMGVAFISRELGFLYASPEICVMFNVEEERLQYLTVEQLNMKFSEAIQLSIEDNSIKVILCTQHNMLRHYEIETKVIEDNKKRLIGYIIMIKDTTVSYRDQVQQLLNEQYILTI